MIITFVSKNWFRFARENGANDLTAENTIGKHLKEFITDIYLVLDDLHKARDPEWLTVLFNNLAEDFPEKLHVVITTRTVPKFDLTKFSSKRNLLLLDSKDLRFDTEETAGSCSFT